MTEPRYRQLRHDGLQACREYRHRMRQALGYAEIEQEGHPSWAAGWRHSAADWYRRLRKEQLLLVALRSSGRVLAWQQAVIKAYYAEQDERSHP